MLLAWALELHTKATVMNEETAKEIRDKLRISLKQPYEVHYWTTRLGIDKVTLETYIEQVGALVKDIETLIRSKAGLTTKLKISF